MKGVSDLWVRLRMDIVIDVRVVRIWLSCWVMMDVFGLWARLRRFIVRFGKLL